MLESIPYDGSLTQLLSNPIVAGIAVLYVLAIMSFLFRNIPAKIYGFLQRRYTVEIVFKDDGHEEQKLMNSFIRWFFEQGHHKHSRTFTLNQFDFSQHDAITNEESDNKTFDEQRLEKHESDNLSDKFGVTPGYGFHWFFHNGRPYWFTYEQADIKSRLVYQISMKTLGRSQTPLFKLLDHVKPKPKIDHRLDHFIHDGRISWHHAGKIPKRDITSLALNEDLRTSIIQDIENFFNDPFWYIDNGLPYKYTILLSGPPGTGKTSLAKALASRYNRNMCQLNLSQCSDTAFASAIMEMPPRSVLLLEDFDSVESLNKRDIDLNSEAANENAWKKLQSLALGNRGLTSNKVEDPSEIEEDQSDVGVASRRLSPPKFSSTDGPTLSGVLNTLDGVQSLDGHIIIMTTNTLSTVDEAVYRPGRVDYIYEVGFLTDKEIRDYSQKVFPDFDFSEYHFVDQPGCNLHAALIKCRRDPQVYADTLWTQPADNPSAVGETKEVEYST